MIQTKFAEKIKTDILYTVTSLLSPSPVKRGVFRFAENVAETGRTQMNII
jgi:hypothetical protein